MIKRDVQKSHEYNHNHHWFSAPQHGAEVLHRPGQGQLLDWPLPEAGAGEAPRATVLDEHLAVTIGQREEVGGRLLPAIQRRQRLNVVFYRRLRSRVAPGIWDVKISKPTSNERSCIVKTSSIPCYHFVKLDIQRFDSVRSFPPPLVSFFTFYHFHQHPLYSSRNFCTLTIAL